ASRDEAMAWVIRNQFARRNLTPYQRAELALKLEETYRAKGRANMYHEPCQKSDKAIDTKKELGRIAGVSHDTLARAKKLADHADEQTKAALREGRTTINQAYTRLRRAEKAEKKETRPVPGADVRLYHCGVADLHRNVEAHSLDHIVTDPPYP